MMILYLFCENLRKNAIYSYYWGFSGIGGALAFTVQRKKIGIELSFYFPAFSDCCSFDDQVRYIQFYP